MNTETWLILPERTDAWACDTRAIADDGNDLTGVERTRLETRTYLVTRGRLRGPLARLYKSETAVDRYATRSLLASKAIDVFDPYGELIEHWDDDAKEARDP